MVLTDKGDSGTGTVSKITKEDLKLQKELLELQEAMGKVVAKDKLDSVLKRLKSNVVGEFIGELDQNLMYDILDYYSDLIKKELNKKR